MPLEPIIPGAAWTVQLERVSGDAYAPSDRRVLLVLDSPKSAEIRITKEYLPAGGSSDGVTAVGDAVRFTLSTTDTVVCDGNEGQWYLFMFVGDAVDQYPLVPTTTARVQVIVPPQGVVPHV